VLIACWSVKGGSGTTVVAAALGLLAARSPGDALLVDTAGDLPAALGLPEPAGPGLAEWLAADTTVAAAALHHLEVEVRAGLRLLPAGAGRLALPGAAAPPGRATELALHLAGDQRTVVVDAGIPGPAAIEVVAAAERSLLVLRPCYLALRRAVASPIRPSGVVLVREPRRALRRADVEAVLGAPVVAQVELDPEVARVVDAGLLGARLPRTLELGLRPAA
jgi:MinD-like ATPase involved in chromosome partitioning or flagellar assembly